VVGLGNGGSVVGLGNGGSVVGLGSGGRVVGLGSGGRVVGLGSGTGDSGGVLGVVAGTDVGSLDGLVGVDGSDVGTVGVDVGSPGSEPPDGSGTGDNRAVTTPPVVLIGSCTTLIGPPTAIAVTPAATVATATPWVIAVTDSSPTCCSRAKNGSWTRSETGPVFHSSLGNEMLRKARTISGSNWPPAQSASSRRAAHTAIGFL